MLIVGMGALARADGAQVLATARTIAEGCGMVQDTGGWNGFNVLHTAAARVGGLDLGFLPGDGGLDTGAIVDAASAGAVAVVYLLGADEIDMDSLGKAFVIYQGHHGDAGAERADVILPGAAYTEKNATYVNTEGRVQQGRRAVYPPGEAREDWAIIRALSEVLGRKLPVDTRDDVRARMAEVNPNFAAGPDAVETAPWGAFGTDGPMDPAPFRTPVANFYMTDPISRASVTMAECTDALAGAQRERTGTDG
jgi:NADH-quinone oxidoreductase subunit G